MTTRPATQPATQPATRPAPRPTTAPATGPAAQPEGPNIIFLLSGDQASGMTGFEGNTTIKTPNLDRLAATGAWFPRCYTPTPRSAPAKATVLTGQYPHTHGVEADDAALAPDADTFTDRLKKLGFICGFVGQWDQPETGREPGFGMTDYLAMDDGQWANATTWVNGTRGNTTAYLTDWQADRAIEFLDKFKDRPFFLWVNFRAPAEPFEYPPTMESKYPPDSMTLPSTTKVDRNTWPPTLKTPALPQAATQYDRRKTDEKALRLDRSKYYAMISRLDENVGRVLEQVDKLDLSENTIVVFACCNGYALGDHTLWGKGPFFYEELVRGPLIIRWPDLAEGGAKIDRIVGLADLAPTFLQAAGQRKPFTMQGDSLVPLLKDPRDYNRGDEEFFEYELPPPTAPPPVGIRQAGPPPAITPPIGQNTAGVVRGLVTKNYKYVEYPGGAYAFFDLKRDPDEMQNIMNLMGEIGEGKVYKRNYTPMVNVLKERLNKWRKQTHDPTLK